jgi:toxin ParE1/3/4
MSYGIERTDKVGDQLLEIVQYIAADSGSAEIAIHYLDKLEAAVMRLAEQPYLGRFPRYGILKRQGYRVLIVERHLIFYKVDEARRMVMIHAIVDGRRAYQHLI